MSAVSNTVDSRLHAHQKRLQDLAQQCCVCTQKSRSDRGEERAYSLVQKADGAIVLQLGLSQSSVHKPPGVAQGNGHIAVIVEGLCNLASN